MYVYTCIIHVHMHLWVAGPAPASPGASGREASAAAIACKRREGTLLLLLLLLLSLLSSLLPCLGTLSVVVASMFRCCFVYAYKKGWRVLLTEMLLPRIARQGSVNLISVRGFARKTHIYKVELEQLELKTLSSMRVSNRKIPPSDAWTGSASGTPARTRRLHAAWSMSMLMLTIISL